MTTVSREGFCITEVPCLIEIAGVGVFEAHEWGLRGFKLLKTDELELVGRKLQVELGLKGKNSQKIKLSAERLPAIGSESFMYFNFAGLRAPEWFALLGLVVSAQTLTFLEQEKRDKT